MKNLTTLALLVTLTSCSMVNLPTSTTFPRPTYPNSGVRSTAEIEREFQTLNQNYKQNTTEILDLLVNDDPASSRTAISVENISRCNFVLTISGENTTIKIPIGVGQTRGAVLTKGQYRLSSQICSSTYNQVKQIQNSLTLKLKD